MKLKEESYPIQKSEDFTEMDFIIDSGSAKQMMKMLYSNLYSDPIGSIVREVASNSLDAHIEAGNVDTSKFIVSLVDEDSLFGDTEPSISFRDFGVGLSKDRMDKIYRRYFASTKNADNTQIGGYGLGAKSPLAYADSFNVNTYIDGVEYAYMVQIVGDGETKLILLKESPTTELNGTLVRIPIKSEDYEKFEKALNKQLLLLQRHCEIYANGELLPDILTASFEDEYVILGESTIDPDANPVYLACGPVVYNIPADIASSPTSLPIILKCNVGDVSTSMNREALFFDPKTVTFVEALYKQGRDSLEAETMEEIKKVGEGSTGLSTLLTTVYYIEKARNRYRRDDTIVTGACVDKALAGLIMSIPTLNFDLGVMLDTFLYKGLPLKVYRDALKTDSVCSSLSWKDSRRSMTTVFPAYSYSFGNTILELTDIFIYKDENLTERKARALTSAYSTIILVNPEYIKDATIKEVIKNSIRSLSSFDLEGELEPFDDYEETVRNIRPTVNIPLRVIRRSYSDGIPAYNMTSINPVDLDPSGVTYIYGNTSDSDSLISLFKLMQYNKATKAPTGYYNSKTLLDGMSLIFCKIAEGNNKHFESMSNAFTVREYFMAFKEEVTKAVTTVIVSSSLLGWNYCLKTLPEYSKYVNRNSKIVDPYYNTYLDDAVSMVEGSAIRELTGGAATYTDYIDPTVLEAANNLLSYFAGLETIETLKATMDMYPDSFKFILQKTKGAEFDEEPEEIK